MSEHAIPKVTSPVARDTPNYPRDHWWVAATSAELATSPIERTLLGLPVVLYRRGNEEAVALDGRCPHRWAPLSMGSIEGDDIVFRYHGLRFNPEGKCTLIPTQDRIPNLQKRAYPIVEGITPRGGCGKMVVVLQRI